MLYTRCPQCDTTFRITENALTQAGGQVRCGRCSHIFDARDSLSDRLNDADDMPSPEAASMKGPKGQVTEASTAPAVSTSAAEPARRAESDAASEERPATAGDAGTIPAADEVEAAGASRDPDDDKDEDGGETDTPMLSHGNGVDAGDRDDTDSTPPEDRDPKAEPETDAAVMSADEIHAVLKTPPADPAAGWIPDDEPQRRSALWKGAAAFAVAALVLQAVHFYRGDLARSETLGPAIESAYALLGSQVVPDWDLGNYELLDWAAVEDPAGAAGQRNLIIRSRLRNNGARAQPYPLIYLRLLDRWEAAVGARVFEPGEYGLSGSQAGGMMRSGEIVAAELVIVDPGADAYGFELAVCLAAQRGIVCDTDATFR